MIPVAEKYVQEQEQAIQRSPEHSWMRRDLVAMQASLAGHRRALGVAEHMRDLIGRIVQGEDVKVPTVGELVDRHALDKGEAEKGIQSIPFLVTERGMQNGPFRTW